MPTFVMLTQLSPEGVQTVKNNPNRIREVNKEIESLGAKVTAQWATLGREHLNEIVELQADRVLARVAGRGITVTLTDAAKQLLGDLGYDPTYGARPLKRVIQKQLVDRLASAILDGTFREGDVVRVDAGEGELVFAKGVVPLDEGAVL